MGGQRFEGKSLEEALENAATALGVERFLVSYHVVLEKRGFLGGTKRVVIEADVADAPAADTAVDFSRPSEPRQDRARSRRQERGSSQPRRGRRDDRHSQEPRFRSAAGDPRLRSFESGSPPEQAPESVDAVNVHEWVQRVIELGGFELEVRTREDDTSIYVDFYGESSGELIERDGELLDSFQVLANKALAGRSTEKLIEFDCAGFKEQRAAELAQLAEETAAQVRAEGREHLLPAMSPIERRIIHLALENDQDVTTESRGDGFYKRVAIIFRSRPAGQ